MGGVLDGGHAGGAGGEYVFFAVVEEEDGGGWRGEAFGGVVVDGQIGFGDAEAVREGVMVEVLEPGEVGEDSSLHLVAEVGEDAGFDVGALEGGGPVDHGLVGLGPEGGVGGDELAELAGVDGFAEVFGYGLPVGDGVEGAAVVVEAVVPVGGVEELFVGGEDLFEAGPGGGVGWAGEDHAVVE